MIIYEVNVKRVRPNIQDESRMEEVALGSVLFEEETGALKYAEIVNQADLQVFVFPRYVISKEP